MNRIPTWALAVALVVVVGIAAGGLFLMSGSDDEGDSPSSSLGTWAAAYCAIGNELGRALVSVPDSRQMPFPQRQQAAVQGTGTYIDALNHAGSSLRDLKPPGNARRMHNDYLALVTKTEAALRRAQTKYAEARSAQDIEAANADLAVAQAAAAKPLSDRSRYPEEVLAALAGVTGCVAS